MGEATRREILLALAALGVTLTPEQAAAFQQLPLRNPHSTLDADGYRLNLPWGYIYVDNNEVHIVSTVEDPPKVRQSATAGISLGCWSFGRMRPDGVEEEVVLFQGKIDERFRNNPTHYSGEFTLHIRDGSDPNADRGMKKIFQMRHDGIEYYVPVRNS